MLDRASHYGACQYAPSNIVAVAVDRAAEIVSRFAGTASQFASHFTRWRLHPFASGSTASVARTDRHRVGGLWLPGQDREHGTEELAGPTPGATRNAAAANPINKSDMPAPG